MTRTLTLALAQHNYTVGAIADNKTRIAAAYAAAKENGADMLVTPEMAITGYPAEDLVFKRAFQDAAIEAVKKLAKLTAEEGSTAMLIGGLWRDDEGIYNASFLCEGGTIQKIITKRSLPNYGVFDEKRLFTKGERPKIVEWRGWKLGILICEDMWDERWAHALAKQGAELLITQNASPYESGKAGLRRNTAELITRQNKIPLVYLNIIGGQDELVFDGRSFCLTSHGDDVVRFKAFEEELGIVTIQDSGVRAQTPAMAHSEDSSEAQGQTLTFSGPLHPPLTDEETIYSTMVLGLRDYVEKNRFPGVILGLSGGIDSGLTAAVAVDALGPERVHSVLMPSPYTSDDSLEDATQCAEALGIELDSIVIDHGMKAFDGMLENQFKGTSKDITEENIQSRIRGMLLMAISNKLGYMVLTTGNKSEMSVGYATLYGDMCGGYSVLKDVYKTKVFHLSEWRNTLTAETRLPLFHGPVGQVIPPRMISKPPTAELRADQKDSDSLPPYDVLDAILMGLIERRESPQEIADKGYDLELVKDIMKKLYRAEYKRRQAPPGVKISGMSFDKDRRYPITNGWI